MLKLSSIKADTARENDGDWVSVPDLPGVRLKVRSLEYSPYRMARDLLVQKFARKYGRRPVPPEVTTAEFGKLYATHILLDWEGVADDSGVAIKLTREVAIEYLTDPEFRRLTAAVEWAASMVAETEADFTEDSSKNSAPPSATI